jgi:hypothetical protein
MSSPSRSPSVQRAEGLPPPTLSQERQRRAQRNRLEWIGKYAAKRTETQRFITDRFDGFLFQVSQLQSAVRSGLVRRNDVRFPLNWYVEATLHAQEAPTRARKGTFRTRRRRACTPPRSASTLPVLTDGR